jgi:hypothetical protein
MPLLVLLSLLIAMSAPACRNISLRTGKYLQEFLGDALTKWLNSLIVIVTAWLAILAVGATAVLLNNGETIISGPPPRQDHGATTNVQRVAARESNRPPAKFVGECFPCKITGIQPPREAAISCQLGAICSRRARVRIGHRTATG